LAVETHFFASALNSSTDMPVSVAARIARHLSPAESETPARIFRRRTQAIRTS
jgi:hypothetical protein